MTVELEMMKEENGRLRRHIKCLEAELKNTTLTVPSGGNSGGAHTVGEVMALCERWRVAGGREEHHAYKEEIERVVEKLVSDRDVLLSAMEELARLGNEPHYGNSNMIARAAIQKVTNHE